MELRGTYKCGHIGAIEIRGLENVKKDGNNFGWLCPKCQKIDMANRAAVQAEETKLPELKGSENQVLCGMIKRMEAIESMDRMFNCMIIPGSENEKIRMMKVFNCTLKSETDAEFWFGDVSGRLIDKFIEVAKKNFITEEDKNESVYP